MSVYSHCYGTDRKKVKRESAERRGASRSCMAGRRCVFRLLSVCVMVIDRREVNADLSACVLKGSGNSPCQTSRVNPVIAGFNPRI